MVTVLDPPDDSPTWRSVPDGEWLVGFRRTIDYSEHRWLVRLGRFDASGEWRDDGQPCTAVWLMQYLQMKRSTAFAKVGVAREMIARPWLGRAFGDGRVNYSGMRILADVKGTDRETDMVFVEAFEAGGLSDLTHVIAHYREVREQDLPPSEREHRAGTPGAIHRRRLLPGDRVPERSRGGGAGGGTPAHRRPGRGPHRRGGRRVPRGDCLLGSRVSRGDWDRWVDPEQHGGRGRGGR